jgi:hypothetical protein
MLYVMNRRDRRWPAPTGNITWRRGGRVKQIEAVAQALAGRNN